MQTIFLVAVLFLNSCFQLIHVSAGSNGLEAVQNKASFYANASGAGGANRLNPKQRAAKVRMNQGGRGGKGTNLPKLSTNARNGNWVVPKAKAGDEGKYDLLNGYYERNASICVVNNGKTGAKISNMEIILWKLQSLIPIIRSQQLANLEKEKFELELMQAKGNRAHNEKIKLQLEALNAQITIEELKKQVKGNTKTFKNAVNGKNVVQIEGVDGSNFPIARVDYALGSDCFTVSWKNGFKVEELLTVEIRYEGTKMAQTGYINAWEQPLDSGEFMYDFGTRKLTKK